MSEVEKTADKLAEMAMRMIVAEFQAGKRVFEDMDDDSLVCVAVDIAEAVIDAAWKRSVIYHESSLEDGNVPRGT